MEMEDLITAISSGLKDSAMVVYNHSRSESTKIGDICGRCDAMCSRVVTVTSIMRYDG